MTTSIAHRGDWSKYPENTMQAFQAAANAHADMLELDVKMTKDGYAVLLHDDTLERLWGDKRRVSDLTWHEIRTVCHGTYKIPLFDDIINSLPMPFMVDFVDLDAVKGIVDVMRRQHSLSRFLIVTGNIPALRRMKQLLPEATIGLTWNDAVPPTDELLHDVGATFFNPYWVLLNQGVVDHMHQSGFKVSCWTVDEPAEMQRLIGMGVDAMVTNHISTLTTLLAEH